MMTTYRNSKIWIVAGILLFVSILLVVDFVSSYARYKRDYCPLPPMYDSKSRLIEYFEFSQNKFLKKVTITIQNNALTASVLSIERDKDKVNEGVGRGGELSKDDFERLWSQAFLIDLKTRKCTPADFADKVWGLFVDNDLTPKTVIVTGKDFNRQPVKAFQEEAERIEQKIAYTGKARMPLSNAEKGAYWLALSPIQNTPDSVGLFALFWLHQKLQSIGLGKLVD